LHAGDALRRAPLDRSDTGTARRVRLGDVDVDYRLVRARRRTIGMEIDLDGLTVRAPRWVAIAEVEAALRERAAWILRTLDAWRGRRRDVLPREWKSGAPILYRGRELALAVFRSRRALVRPDLFDLTVLHPHAGDETHVSGFVRQWLREEALRLVAPRAAEFAARLARNAPPVRISNARSEWGSCNHRGEIRLNWRLSQLPADLADYVVAHEVAHLVELNHSARFWAVVEALMPGHAARRRALDDWTALLASP
jgi:predicted metal-dependent hydrolase